MSAAPKASPWGAVDHATAIGTEGIWSVSTPSHGGFYVPDALLARIPEAHRAYGARWSHGWGENWYEEDCACCAVILAFPDLFTAENVSAARYVVEKGFAL